MADEYVIWRPDAPANVVGFASLDAARAALALAAGRMSVAGWCIVRCPAEGEWETVEEVSE